MSKIIGRVFPALIPPAADPEGIGDKGPEKMTVAQLTAYAAAHDIGIEGLAKKADILAAIQAAQETDEQPEQ